MISGIQNILLENFKFNSPRASIQKDFVVVILIGSLFTIVLNSKRIDPLLAMPLDRISFAVEKYIQKCFYLHNHCFDFFLTHICILLFFYFIFLHSKHTMIQKETQIYNQSNQ